MVKTQESISKKVIILDDDEWPTGRITENILPEFKRKGIKEGNIIHYLTFIDLKEDLRTGKISKDNLFVLDSSLTKEPNNKLLSFETTVPFLLDSGINPKKLMPGSGAREGTVNNTFFEKIYERRGRTTNLNQMGLFGIGLSGAPQEVASAILTYYNDLYPETRLERETSQPKICEGSLKYWKQKQQNEGNEGRL